MMGTTTTRVGDEAAQLPEPELGLVARAPSALAAPCPEVSAPVTLPPRQRRARRDELLIKVRVGDGMLVARVEDISITGLFARTQKLIPVGAFVEMGLLRPGHEELALTGVVAPDESRRAGLAVEFRGLREGAEDELRRIVDHQARSAAGAAEVEATRGMRAPQAGRDREIEELRRRVAVLSADNALLRAEVEAAADAQRLVGRALEIEHVRSRFASAAVVDPELLASIKRDVEHAWTAIARLSDTCDKLAPPSTTERR